MASTKKVVVDDDHGVARSSSGEAAAETRRGCAPRGSSGAMTSVLEPVTS
jgi:hypothetical protein